MKPRIIFFIMIISSETNFPRDPLSIFHNKKFAKFLQNNYR